MKNIFFKIGLLLILALGGAFAQPSRGPASVANPYVLDLQTMGGKVWPLLRESFDSGNSHKPYLIHLDTTEVDTGYMWINVLQRPIFTWTDTVGVVSFTCKDSTGTDTIAIVLKWQGNTRPDGKGVWANVDSIELKDLAASGAAGQGVYRDTSKVVTTTGRYTMLRFFLRNKLASNANRKATCKDALFFTRPRAGYRP